MEVRLDSLSSPASTPLTLLEESLLSVFSTTWSLTPTTVDVVVEEVGASAEGEVPRDSSVSALRADVWRTI